MRTKTLLMAAAALAAGVISSQAQSTVYSQNIVGYVNIALPSGTEVLAAPALDVDGTGTNGTISTVVGTNVDAGTTVLVWNGTGYTLLTYEAPTRGAAVGWYTGIPAVAAPNFPLNVGEGFFIEDPGPGVTNLTETGVVMQGALTQNLAGGVESLVSSEVPIAGDLTTNLNYIPNAGDTALIWNGSGYTSYTYEAPTRGATVAWYTGIPAVQQDPVLNVGQGFFLEPVSANAWTETFTNN